MKRILIPVLALGLFAVAPATLNAQEKKEKKEKLEEYDEIVIRKKKDGDSKVTVEIKDGTVTVNGQPLEKFDDENVAVLKKKARVMSLTSPDEVIVQGYPSPFRRRGGVTEFRRELNTNKAMLGVLTEAKDGNVVINEVSENSAAAKAGLQKGDIILKVDDIKVSTPQDLIEAIGKYKPEEKITVTVKRDGKEKKITATLGVREEKDVVIRRGLPMGPEGQMPGLENFKFDFDMDGLRGLEDLRQFEVIANGRPRLGIRAQDTEDGKGVKVLDVDDESAAAKAGIREGDVITEFNGQTVNSADELVKASRDSKDKSSFPVKISRDGKSQTVEVKIPKKLKTATL